MDMNDTVQTEILTLEDLQRQKAEACLLYTSDAADE